jgi:hypothetical protein
LARFPFLIIGATLLAVLASLALAHFVTIGESADGRLQGFAALSVDMDMKQFRVSGHSSNLNDEIATSIKGNDANAQYNDINSLRNNGGGRRRLLTDDVAPVVAAEPREGPFVPPLPTTSLDDTADRSTTSILPPAPLSNSAFLKKWGYTSPSPAALLGIRDDDDDADAAAAAAAAAARHATLSNGLGVAPLPPSPAPQSSFDGHRHFTTQAGACLRFC